MSDASSAFSADTARSGGFGGMLRRGEAWLDRKGRWAWIAATVVAFVLFWPVGLALLAYILWSKRMFGSSCARRGHRHHRHDASREAFHDFVRSGLRSSGNTSFDRYKADALKRLEEEQSAFESFIQRLRDAKDKSQFDAFMEDRARENRAADDAAEAPSATRPTPPAPEAEGGRGGAY
jgi:hypothetical protein